MSVAEENTSGTVVDTKRDGATTIAVAVKPVLLFFHHFPTNQLNFVLDFCKRNQDLSLKIMTVFGNRVEFACVEEEVFQVKLLTICSLKN